MKVFKYLPILIAAFLVLPGFSSTATAAERKPFDHSLFDAVLKQVVNKDGDVDYAKLVADPSNLEAYMKKLAAIDKWTFEEESAGWTREERLALWLNAYHAAILETVRLHYPVDNIQGISGVWETRFFDVAGTLFSLNGISKTKLLGAFRDEKIHAALACGAVSCPPFPREAFTGPRVEGQLFLATRAFVNNPDFVHVVPKENKVYLSKIFRWYARDFQLDFGAWTEDSKFSRSEFAILSFVAHYLEDYDQVQYLEEGNYKIKYLPFSWKLREAAPAKTPPAES